MRPIAITIAVLIVVFVVMYFINRGIVKPNRNRRRIQRIEEDNARLDAIINQQPTTTRRR